MTDKIIIQTEQQYKKSFIKYHKQLTNLLGYDPVK